MGIIILQLVMMLANLACVVWMYGLKEYKVAFLNAFAAGVCWMGFIVELLKHI